MNWKDQRAIFLDRHHDSWRARYFSAGILSLWQTNSSLTREHCTGLVLDAGCGRQSWKKLILEHCTEYHSIDIRPQGEVTYIGSVEDMPMISSGTYDTIVCHQVLEHVRRPWLAAREFHRILRPGGKAIVSVPHLSRYHELPFDFFRYTAHGLASMFEDAGFLTHTLKPYGGLICFMHHQLSFLFPGLLAGIPGIGDVAVALNAAASSLITSFDFTGKLFPLGIVAVFQKPGPAPEDRGSLGASRE
jgi:SAM-dependent methyltransferase